MKKITKKPKGVVVYWRPTQGEYSTYTCPSCGTEFRGWVAEKHTTRFKCDCGQELIISHHIDINPKT